MDRLDDGSVRLTMRRSPVAGAAAAHLPIDIPADKWARMAAEILFELERRPRD
jgi:hypothetical protein